jgi:hypothetical protein
LTDAQSTPAGFDPYAEFLHLPPGPRPPHFYDLLGVELFCAHRERIEHAARERYRLIKPFQDHRDRQTRDAVQTIITRIANARIVLTDPEKRATYDQRLSEALGLDRDGLLRERTAARAPEFALRVIAGAESVGHRLALLPDRELVIGGDPACGLYLPGLRMLPRHAQLIFANEAWQLHSTANGLTLVNDQRVEQTLLDEADVIDLGGYRLRFDRIDAREPAAATLPPPISLMIRQGPSVAHPTINAVAPAEILIGTCDTALWQLTGKPVAVHHARVSADGALWEIKDLHSETGTWHNGEKVRTAILNHRDQVQIGGFDVQVSLRK